MRTVPLAEGEESAGKRAESADRPIPSPVRHQVKRSGALSVVVDDRGIDSALRTFKKLIAKEGLLKDLKRRQHYEKPGERRRRKRREAVRRRRRQEARARRQGG